MLCNARLAASLHLLAFPYRLQHLNEAVGRKFGVLERQLEGKVSDQQEQFKLVNARLCTPPFWSTSTLHLGELTTCTASPRTLAEQMKDINDATLAFQERLNSLWEEYRTLFDRMAGTAAVSAI
jgi:hypothetical protein